MLSRINNPLFLKTILKDRKKRLKYGKTKIAKTI